MRCRTLVLTAGLLALAALACPTASAALIAATSFDDADGDGELAGETGGFGWTTTGWAANTARTELVDPGGTMVAAVPGALSVDGGAWALEVNGTSTLTARALASSFDATTHPDVYMSFLFRWEAGAVNGNDFAVFRYNTTDVNVGLKANEGPGGTDFVARFDTGHQAYGDEQIAIGETAFIAAHLADSDADGDYDSHAIWTNPAYTDAGSPEAIINGANFGATIDTITMRYVNLDGNDVLLFDELKLGTAWEDVMPPIPEPATVSLLALGALALARRRRRRKP